MWFDADRALFRKENELCSIWQCRRQCVNAGEHALPGERGECSQRCEQFCQFGVSDGQRRAE